MTTAQLARARVSRTCAGRGRRWRWCPPSPSPLAGFGWMAALRS